MGSSFTVRLGAKSDFPELGELWRMLVRFNVERNRRLPDLQVDGVDRWTSWIGKRLKDPTFRLYVAEKDRMLIGFVTGFLNFVPDPFEERKVGKIGDLFVATEWRRRGVATSLLASLTDWFEEEAVDHLEVNMVAMNATAVGFWRGVGAQDFTMQMWMPTTWRLEK